MDHREDLSHRRRCGRCLIDRRSRTFCNAAELTFAQALDEIAAKTAVSDHHPDAIEGMKAFAEKREPRFDQGLGRAS